jgi:hypothetical protein
MSNNLDDLTEETKESVYRSMFLFFEELDSKKQEDICNYIINNLSQSNYDHPNDGYLFQEFYLILSF